MDQCDTTATEEIILLGDSDELDLENFMSETIGSAIIDTGCTFTVCGDLWFQTYLDTLSCKEKDTIVYTPSSRWYRFGESNKVKATKNVVLPLHIGDQKTTISVDVVKQVLYLCCSQNLPCQKQRL